MAAVAALARQQRLEGKTYVMQDYDVVNLRFNKLADRFFAARAAERQVGRASVLKFALQR